MEPGPLTSNGFGEKRSGRPHAVSSEPPTTQKAPSLQSSRKMEASPPPEGPPAIFQRNDTAHTTAIDVDAILTTLNLPQRSLTRAIIHYFQVLHLPLTRETILKVQREALQFSSEQQPQAAFLHTLGLSKKLDLSASFIRRALWLIFPSSVQNLPNPPFEGVSPHMIHPDGDPHEHEGSPLFEEADASPSDADGSLAGDHQEEGKDHHPPNHEPPASFGNPLDYWGPLLSKLPFNVVEELQGSLIHPSWMFWDLFTRLPSSTGREWWILPLGDLENMKSPSYRGSLRFLFSSVPGNLPILHHMTLDVYTSTNRRYVYSYSGITNQKAQRLIIMSSPQIADKKTIEQILAPFVDEIRWHELPPGPIPELEELVNL